MGPGFNFRSGWHEPGTIQRNIHLTSLVLLAEQGLEPTGSVELEFATTLGLSDSLRTTLNEPAFQPCKEPDARPHLASGSSLGELE